MNEGHQTFLHNFLLPFKLRPVRFGLLAARGVTRVEAVQLGSKPVDTGIKFAVLSILSVRDQGYTGPGLSAYLDQGFLQVTLHLLDSQAIVAGLFSDLACCCSCTRSCRHSLTCPRLCPTSREKEKRKCHGRLFEDVEGEPICSWDDGEEKDEEDDDGQMERRTVWYGRWTSSNDGRKDPGHLTTPAQRGNAVSLPASGLHKHSKCANKRRWCLEIFICAEFTAAQG